MLNAVINVPTPKNEPIKSYAPGTPERAELQKEIAAQRATPIEIPLIIGGEEMRTGDLGECRMPHQHGHLLAKFHKASKAHVQAAIEVARRARPAWAALDWEQRAAIFTSILDPATDRILRLSLCQYAAEFGFADLAFERLFGAFDTGRPIGGFRSSQGGINRAYIPFFLFIPEGKALRRDKRFPILCRRMGLVDYWRTSGHWPDCVNEVPYDFKAECEKLATTS